MHAEDLDLEKLQVAIDDIPHELAVLPVSDAVIFPGMMVPLVISDQKLIQLAEDVLDGEKLFGAFTQRPLDGAETDIPEDDVAAESIFDVGTIVAVQKTLRFPDGSIRLLGKGICRAKIEKFTMQEPYLRAKLSLHEDPIKKQKSQLAVMQRVCTLFGKLADLSDQVPSELKVLARETKSGGALADLIATNVDFQVTDKQHVLELLSPSKRLTEVIRLLQQELRVLQLGEKLHSDVREEIDRDQREYYLRQQMKAIRKELGDSDDEMPEGEELRNRIEEAELSDESREAVLKELERLVKMSPASAEYTVSKSYIDWILELPWKTVTRDQHDIRRAGRILDEDHYNLTKVKERILEFLAVKKLKKEMKGPILCLAGPPGVGKTSLGRSVARSLGRKFARISLGGMRDEAEIRGHRRTYVGAMPGRIIQCLKTAGSNNPVFMLDELDKLGNDFRGDPASALLEVLDPAQNSAFSDHYLNLPFDLSNVLFIATANSLDNIPVMLRDRMEIIEIAGYINREKLEIAKRYLVRRQTQAHGLTSSHLTFTDAGLMSIISGYTREAGVRQLERCIGAVCRRVAKSVASGKKLKLSLNRDNITDYLGNPGFTSEVAMRRAEIGVATGLAWTQTGGDILFIEAVMMPGKGQLKLTGSLGQVMRESVEAALSHLRSSAAYGMMEPDYFDRHDFHVHVPAGATPKDGPSAGVTVTTALASLLQGIPVRNDVAMTGEITLTGRVLPVGGVRQKLLAAFRAGLREIILPRQNEKDLEEVPKEVLSRLKIHFVTEVDEVVRLALVRPPKHSAREAVSNKLSRKSRKNRKAVGARS